MEPKHIQSIWLDEILLRKKKWEGRCNNGSWQKLKIGDTFTLTDMSRNQEVKIVDIKYFGNFGDAWFILGDELIPQSIENIVMKSEAEKLYRKYYTDAFVEKYGVVAFKLELL